MSNPESAFAPLQHRSGANWKPERGTLLEWHKPNVRAIRFWPQPAAWEKSRRQPAWRGTRLVDLERIVFHSDQMPESKSRTARAEAWATVPERVRHAITQHPFGLRWASGTYAWCLLVIIGRCPGALELAEDVPLLAAALSAVLIDTPKRVTRPLRSFRTLLAAPNGMRRWRKVAGWLGFEPSRALVDYLRRARTDLRWKPEDLHDLRSAWANPKVRKYLQHTPNPGPTTASTYLEIEEANAFERIAPELRAEICTLDQASGFHEPFRQLSAAYTLLWPDRELPRFRTVHEVEVERERIRHAVREHYMTLHARATGQIRAEDAFELTLFTQPAAAFPSPPLPGTLEIQPLTEAGALEEEGRTMRHCIGNGSWASQAYNREGFGYRVEVGTERATLWISRPSGCLEFRVSQLRGPANAAPSVEVHASVERWLDEWNEKLRRRDHTLPDDWRCESPALYGVWPDGNGDWLDDIEIFERRRTYGAPEPLRWAFDRPRPRAAAQNDEAPWMGLEGAPDYIPF
jgi:hypothetical protein